MFEASGLSYGIETIFCKASMARSRSPIPRTHPCESLDRKGHNRRLFDRKDGHGPLRQRQRGRFVTEAIVVMLTAPAGLGSANLLIADDYLRCGPVHFELRAYFLNL
jgi:hypothetical protein